MSSALRWVCRIIASEPSDAVVSKPAWASRMAWKPVPDAMSATWRQSWRRSRRSKNPFSPSARLSQPISRSQRETNSLVYSRL